MSQSNDVMYHQSTTSQTDIVQEILSVAQASHDLTNQEYSWDGNYNNINYGDDFSFLPHSHNNNHDLGNSFNFMDQLKEDDDQNNSIPIADFDEDFKSETMVERLRWVGMSQKDDKVMPLIYAIKFITSFISIYLTQLDFDTKFTKQKHFF